MKSERFDFENKNGETLAGTLDLPDEAPEAFALFAHCFTCNKNVLAASRIARELRSRGFGVLRFDFTGLGNSEGDFANTNFSSNLDDLRFAIGALRDRYQAPQILIGHSLGGAAALFLASEIEEVKLVASIGAPSEPAHVLHLVGEEKLKEIDIVGSANVAIGQHNWSIKKQFVDDVTEVSLKDRLRTSRKPVLILHAPNDQIVGIDNAKKIYSAANHPKSFVSLDGADHLLSGKPDSQFVADVLATWATRYLSLGSDASETSASVNTEQPAIENGVVVTERNKTFTQDIAARTHQLVADEPTSVDGADLGMTPYELLLASLGACTSMTLRMYAKRKGIALEKVRVRLEHDRVHSQDCESCEEQSAKVDRIRKYIHLEGELTEAQRSRMLEIADMCPVNRTLSNQKLIQTFSE